MLPELYLGGSFILGQEVGTLISLKRRLKCPLTFWPSSSVTILTKRPTPHEVPGYVFTFLNISDISYSTQGESSSTYLAGKYANSKIHHIAGY